MPDGRDHLMKRHPCFQQGGGGPRHGRIHLPVSPACNIQCRFCRRCFNKAEERPGVARGILAPEKTVGVVERALKLCPEITVVGVAGPGDTLATPHALRSFELVHERFPELIMCLSTNGLLLEEKADELVRVGVRTVTVTVNAATPESFEKIYAGIVFQGQYLTGKEAGTEFLPAQLAGIRKATSLGLVIKINTVLIPEVNENEVSAIARRAAEAGASLINIIPLIPQHEMAEFLPPDCQAVNRAREAAERHVSVFRHCQHCRADACGIPGSGKDFAGELYDRPMETFSHG
jgi:nitrogen fixation protein NifB